MVVVLKDCLDFIKEHGLDHQYDLIRNHNGYYIITENVNGELWFNVYYDDNVHVMTDWRFSSNDLAECFEYCNIYYY